MSQDSIYPSSAWRSNSTSCKTRTAPCHNYSTK